ncbi:MAG: hypothetical protein V3T88_03960 [Nitrosomonadaceae bacterium]
MTLHNALTGAELHETKGAAAATKGFTLIANGAGTAAYQALLGNVVHVNLLSDLPTAAAGKITLLANTIYLFGASVNIGTDFLLFSNGSSIQCLAAFTSTVTYTGTVPMLQGDNANARIKDINLLCATANVYGWADSTPGTSIVIITDVLVIACLKVGVFNDVGTLVIQGSTVVSCTSGITYLGSGISGTRLSSINFISTSTTFIGLDFTGATLNNVNVDGMQMSGGVGSIGIKGDAASVNLAANRIGHVSHVQFQGITTPLSGITLDDIRWNFQANGDLADTMPDALTSLTANAAATVVSVGVPTLVTGTWVQVRASQYSTTAAGRITLLSERDVVTPIDVTISVEPVSGTNKILRAYIALNGAAIIASGISTHADNADPRVISIPWQLNLSETDFVEVFVENETDSVDILVSDATLRVR